MIKDKNKKDGFTLVEMMVSVSLFVIVAMVVSVAFVTLANIYRKIQSNRAVIDNINFMMDTISYELREGKEWEVEVGDTCSNGKPSCYTAISFTRLDDTPSVGNDRVTYKLEDQSVYQVVDNGIPVSLNSPEVRIDAFEIYTNPDLAASKATIIIHGIAQATPKITTDFTLQTTVSQRN